VAKQKVRSAGRNANQANLPVKAPMGKNYLLVIGIDEYEDYGPLPNASKDAKAIAALLKERYCFDTNDVEELCGKEACRSNIIKRIERLYSLEGAKNACPKGWRLPTDEEWNALAVSFGGYIDKDIDGFKGDPERAYYGVINALQVKEFPGFYTGLDFDHNNVASYWSMTNAADDEYFNYDFAKGSQKLYRTKSPPYIGLFCRCVKDNDLIVKNKAQQNDPFYNHMVFGEGGNFNLEKIFYSLDTPVPDCMVNDFYISKFLVTQAQWVRIMGDPRLSRGPSWFKDDDNLPVEYISWHNAVCSQFSRNNSSGRSKKAQ